MPFLGTATTILSSGAGAVGPPPNLSIVSNAAAVWFQGTNQYVSTDYDPSTIGTGDFTVSVWGMLPRIKTSGSNVALFSLGDANNYIAIIYLAASAQYRLSYSKAGSASTAILVSSPDFFTFYQLTLTRTGTTIVVYLDGTEVYNATDAAFDVNLGATCNIGADVSGTTTYKGILDEFAIWSAVLDATAATAIYGSGTPRDLTGTSQGYNKAASLETWFRMSELTGTSLADSSANSYVGTFQNTPSWVAASPSLAKPTYAATQSVEFDGVSDALYPMFSIGSLIGTGDFTFFARFKVDALTPSQNIFYAGDASSTNFCSAYVNSATGKLTAVTRLTSLQTYGLSGALSTGTWYDCAVVRSSGTMTAYMGETYNSDIASIGSVGSQGGAIGPGVTSLASFNFASNLLNGNLADVALWNSALTLTELQRLNASAFDFTSDDGNYTSSANLKHFLVAVEKTNTMVDLVADGHGIFYNSPTWPDPAEAPA